MRLFLIRHGQTTSNQQRVYVGQGNVMLTEEGRAQARRIRPILEKFKFDRVYSSDLQRAIDTQELALPDAQAVRTPLLREFHVGSAQGQPFGVPWVGKPESCRKERDYSVLGGESAEMVTDRLRLFLKELEEDPCDNVAAFAHNGLLSCMLRIVLDASIDLSGAVSPNCAIHVFDYVDGAWKLKAWNYQGEL